MKIQSDKIKHFLIGLSISIFIGIMLSSWIVGLITSGFAGVAKEYYDSKNKENHTVDLWDAIWTLLGGVIGSLVVFLALRY